jgi:hypothetical protein
MPCSKNLRVDPERLPYDWFGAPRKGSRHPSVVVRSVMLPSVNQIS